MARGSDAATLDRENRSRFGEHLNADELIRAHAASVDPALQKVLGYKTDDEATEKVEADLDAHAGKFSLAEGETLVSAAVHGNALVGVIETPDGRHRKQVVGYTDDFAGVKLTPAEQEAYARAQAEGQVASETAKVREAAAAQVAEAEAEIERETSEKIAKIQADAAKRVADAEAEAEKAKSEPAPAKAKPKAKPAAAKKT